MDDGGPAFPLETTATPYAPGMSLRDWLAGAAPVTLTDAVRICGWHPEFIPTQDSERAALWAIMTRLRYEYADAMITARSIKGDDNG